MEVKIIPKTENGMREQIEWESRAHCDI
jgi:hypothetical protein